LPLLVDGTVVAVFVSDIVAVADGETEAIVLVNRVLYAVMHEKMLVEEEL